MIKIRKATSADINALIIARCRTMNEVCGFSNDHQFSTQFMENTKEYFLNADATTVIAIDESPENTERIIGNATLCYINVLPTFSHPTGKRAHLMNVYVEKRFRRKGIAKKMIELLEKEAKKHDVTEISLDATEDGRKFYDKMLYSVNDEAMVKKI